MVYASNNDTIIKKYDKFIYRNRTWMRLICKSIMRFCFSSFNVAMHSITLDPEGHYYEQTEHIFKNIHHYIRLFLAFKFD